MIALKLSAVNDAIQHILVLHFDRTLNDLKYDKQFTQITHHQACSS